MAGPQRYPATRYQPPALVDLGSRPARERLSPPALKAFFNIMAHWKVRDEDARGLLGGVTNGPFYEMKRDPDRTLANDRLLAEHQRFPGIGVEELVFGVPCSHVVNAAFCHPHPLGSRFNGPDRGAWYAGFALETAQAEVAFHKRVELAETGWTAEES